MVPLSLRRSLLAAGIPFLTLTLASASWSEGVTVSWKNGKTSIQSDQALVNISSRVQARWTEQMPDTTQLPGTTGKGDAMGSFRIRSAKTQFEGWIYHKNLQYALMLNWASLAGTTPGAALEDAVIDWDVSQKGLFLVRFGQFKPTYDRENVTSDASQQFTDRSIVSREFAKGRETGVELHGLLAGQKVAWATGAFNGNGSSQSANDNNKYAFNARLMFQPYGDVRYSEVDFDSQNKPLVAIAGVWELNDARRDSAHVLVDVKRKVYGADGVFKYKGIFATGEAYWRKIFPASGAEYHSNGYFAQAGYLLNESKTWEAALRYGAWDPTDQVDNNDRTETAAVVNYYYNRHSLKVQTEVARLGDKRKDTQDWEIRVQTQFVF